MTALAERALKGYAAATRGEHFSWWCETYLRQSIDEWNGLPLALEEWQRDFFDEALAVDEHEAPCWRSVALVVPRKNGKTASLAALALYELLEGDGSPEILLAASSDKQAGRLFDAVCAYARMAPELLDRLVIRAYIGEIARADGGGRILRMSSDANRLHGYNPSLVIVDELHAWTTPGLRRAWAAFTTAGGARKRSQTFTITTAGEAHLREASILGRLIDGNEQRGEVERRTPALTISRNAQARTLVFNYSAPTLDPDDVDAMKLANPASWISRDYLERQAANPELTRAEVLQLHGCVWADSKDVWVGADAWSALGDGVGVAGGRVVAVGIDGSRNHDTTAVAWASVDGDRVDVGVRVFSARRDAPHHELCPGGKISYAAVEEFAASLFGRFSVTDAAYDPRYMDRSAELLEERLGAAIVPVEPQSKQMRDALAAFHRGVVEGRVRHDGDVVLAQHLAWTRAEQDERGWVVKKRKHSHPIDAVIAVSLAYWRATHHAAGSSVVLIDPWGDA